MKAKPHARNRCLLLLLMMTTAAVAHAQTPPGFEAAWGQIVDEYKHTLDENGIVGSSLVFLHDGAMIASAYHGLADRDTERAVDENTIYHWASITKTFTGIAIMQLRDRGLLRLDDPIVKYVPELRAVHNPFGEMEAITLRHLLSHAAGFRSPTWPWGGGEDWHPHEPTDWAQLVAMMPYTEVHFAPGSRFGYSNPGIIFLGRVIEALSGDDYEVYIDKNILRPLGMYRTYFDHTPYHLLPYRSNNYLVRTGTPQANGLDFDTGITVSNGGLNAPLPDMATYLAFLMGGPDERYEEVLKRASLEEMWQIHQPVDESNGLKQSMALTFFVLERDGRRWIGHTGSQQAFMSFIYINPATQTGAIAAFNTVGAWEGNRPGPPDTRSLMNALRLKLF